MEDNDAAEVHDESSDTIMDLQTFITYLCTRLDLDVGDTLIDAQSRLIEDLDFDSLGMMELTALLAELVRDRGNVTLEVVDHETIGDIFMYYRSLMADNSDVEPTDFPHATDRRIGDLQGELVTLRPCSQSDLPVLYKMILSDEVARRWRYNGIRPTYETFSSTFTSGVMMQFTVELSKGRGIAGLVTAYNPDYRNRFCYVAAYCDSTLIGTGIVLEAVVLFLKHIFDTWEFVKVYAEVAEFNLKSWASGKGHGFDIEGRLKDHLYFGGRRWDQVIIAAYPAQVENIVARLRRGMLPTFLAIETE